MLNIYKCNRCGNVVVLAVHGGGTLTCCGEQMSLLKPNSTDAAGEKHKPVVEISGKEVVVKVGSVAHPMLPEHHIAFVILETEKAGNAYRHMKQLNAGEAPEAAFTLAEGEKAVAAYEYCNLHGLWVTEL